jgi:Putative zinc-finger
VLTLDVTMPPTDDHLSDQELILAADGELNPRRDAQVRAHLAACWQCRTRLRDLEGAIAHFVHLQASTLDPQMPPAEGARAMLKAQLAEIASQTDARRTWLLPARWPTLAGLAVAMLAMLIVYVAAPRHGERAVPSQELTPGAVRNVATAEVCAANVQPFVVPVALQRRVFEEYGIRNASLNSYEVDYLITPELGGAADIRNLWPEPYSATVWNAHVKDQLEDRLHQLVCDGQLDLATAQHDISNNWIAAYKKYFHTDLPNSNNIRRRN